MVSQIHPLNAASHPNLRQMDPTRDLADIAHVIEVAFANELSPGGHAIMRDLRMLNTFGPLVWLFSHAMPSLRDMFGGYVWVQDGKLVGNITLTRLDELGRQWVISNVAVLPDYRRRSIAYKMMQAAIYHVQLQGGKRIQLQVRHDNDGAKALYQRLGFHYLETVTEMLCDHVYEVNLPSSTYAQICKPDPQRWYDAYEVARAAIPDAIQKIRPLRAENFRIQPRSFFERAWARFFGSGRERWWVEGQERQIMALMTIEQQMNRQNERIEIIIHPLAVGHVEATLVNQLTRRLHGHWGTRLAIAYELTRARSLLRQAGFRELRTLDQMMLEVDSHSF